MGSRGRGRGVKDRGEQGGERRREGEGEGGKGGHVLRSMRKMFACMVASNASQKVSAAIEFAGSIRPYERRERKGHEVLRSV